MKKPSVTQYDGSKYRSVRYFECDCGFKVRTGPMNGNGSYPGSKEMVQHLVDEHGYVSPYQRLVR